MLPLAPLNEALPCGSSEDEHGRETKRGRYLREVRERISDVRVG